MVLSYTVAGQNCVPNFSYNNEDVMLKAKVGKGQIFVAKNFNAMCPS